LSCNYRVDQLVTKHLSVQARLDPRGRLCCFWCPNKIWTCPIGASSALKICQKDNIIEKFIAPRNIRGKKFKKPPNVTKVCFQTPKNSLYVALLLLDLLLLEFKDDFWNFKWHSYNTLNCLTWIRNKKVMRPLKVRVVQRGK
jgi:hypothetical protein